MATGWGCVTLGSELKKAAEEVGWYGENDWV